MAIETVYAGSLVSGAVSGSANALGSGAGTWTTDTGAVSWTARFAMDNPVNDATAGATHTVTVRVRKQAGQSGTPTASVLLYGSGSLIKTLVATTNVTSGTGQDLVGTFTTAELAGLDLDFLQVEVVTTAASGGPSVRSAVQLDYIKLDADTTAAITRTQTTFRGRNDDGDETTATWKATAGTDWSQLPDQNFRIRFNVNASGLAPTQNTILKLYYSKNGGAWTAVGAASSNVRSSASPNVSDGTNTTEQLAGSGTFNPGGFEEADGEVAGWKNTPAAGHDTEVEYCVQIRDVDTSPGDTIGLRVQLSAANLEAYTDTPVITVLAVPVDTVYHVSFPTPSGTLEEVGPQRFRARVYLDGSGSPTGSLLLYENGVEIEEVWSGTVTGTEASPTTVEGVWDATGRTASQIEARFEGTGVSGGTAKLHSIEWLSNLAILPPAVTIDAASGAGAGSASKPTVSRLLEGASGAGAGSAGEVLVTRLIEAATGGAGGGAAKATVSRLIEASSGAASGGAFALVVSRLIEGASGAGGGAAVEVLVARLIEAASGAGAGSATELADITPVLISASSGAAGGSASSVRATRIVSAASGAAGGGEVEVEVTRLLVASSGASGGAEASVEVTRLIAGASGASGGGAFELAVTRLIEAAAGAGAGAAAEVVGVARVLISAASGAGASSAGELLVTRRIEGASGAGAGSSAHVQVARLILAASGAGGGSASEVERIASILASAGVAGGGEADFSTIQIVFISARGGAGAGSRAEVTRTASIEAASGVATGEIVVLAVGEDSIGAPTATVWVLEGPEATMLAPLVAGASSPGVDDAPSANGFEVHQAGASSNVEESVEGEAGEPRQAGATITVE